jgi:hypothetical protein
MQRAVDAEAAAAHGSCRNQHGALARTGDFWQSENQMFGFQISQAAGVFAAAARNADNVAGAADASTT